MQLTRLVHGEKFVLQNGAATRIRIS
jgi:hypothetical protein